MSRVYRFNIWRGQLAVLVVFLILGGLWLAGNWARLLAGLARVDYLGRGEVRSTVDLSGILIADQRVLVAPSAGRIQWLVRDGDRVRVGETVARITTADGETSDVNTPAAGLLSYTTDGLETVLRPAALAGMTMPTLTGIKSVTVADGQEVAAGQSVGRVTDNLAPVYLYVGEKAPPGLGAAGKAWAITWRGQDLTATVSPLRGKEGGLFLKLTRYPDEMLALRGVNFSVVTQTLTGRLVPATAVVSRDGRTGIYLDENGQAQWVAVRVTGSLQGMDRLAGLPAGSVLYVVNPRWVRDGVPVS